MTVHGYIHRQFTKFPWARGIWAGLAVLLNALVFFMHLPTWLQVTVLLPINAWMYYVFTNL